MDPMLSRNERIENATDRPEQAREGFEAIERLLACLREGRLAERIMDCARQATARHIQAEAQDVMSAVEAENSTR